MTAADILLYCYLLFLPLVSVKLSATKFPHVCRWMKSLDQRPVFHAIAQEIQTAVAGD